MSLVVVRKAFPCLAFLLLAGALVYATSFGTLPRADLTFNNATEVKTLDPAQATGEPEGRILEGLFEGLLRRLPDADAPPGSNHENTPITPQFAVADRMEVSDDGRTYTFHIREAARWSDGSELSAHDFAWAWQRMLHPDTVADYKYQLHYLVGAAKYSNAEVAVGDEVEVELADRPNRLQTFPRGTMLRGKLIDVVYPYIEIDKSNSDLEAKTTKQRRDATLFVVDIDGKRRKFGVEPTEITRRDPDANDVEAIEWVLPDFEKSVGLKVVDDHKLIVTLINPTHYFPDLVAFYPLYPVNRACVEKYGWPNFTKAENLVCNGPFKMQFRRIRDRIRLAKNPHYWNADNVQLETIDAMAITSDVAALNMYMTGQLDWITNVPPTIVPEIQERPDFYSAPIAATYFFRINCSRKPLDKKEIRQALSLAIDRQQICEAVFRAHEVPTTSLVPPGITGYVPAAAPPFNPAKARELLAKAGYPNGRGLPKIEILYNTNELHQVVAEVMQSGWKTHLGIDVELRGMEWGSYQNAQQSLQYDVARAGWTGDYLDPYTFLDMFLTNGANNQTGWSNAQYDDLVHRSMSESNAGKRLEMLHQAEEIFVDEMPILPICHYTSKDMLRPYICGFHVNRLKSHPLHLLRVDRKAREHAGRPSK